jgi:hypothetical protein
LFYWVIDIGAFMEELLKWCGEQKEQMQQMMKAGTLRSHEGQVETTDFWLKEYERRITELESILTRHAIRNA